MVAEDRGRRARDQVARDGLVGRDHALLHQRVGRRLALEADRGHPVALEPHDRLGRLGLERPPPHAALPQGGRQGGGPADVLLEGRVPEPAAGQQRVDLGVGQAPLGADEGAREARLPHGPVGVDDHLGRDGGAVHARAQAAQVRGQALRQHRHHGAGDVDRVAAARGLAVERAARRDEPRHVGDVHPQPHRPVALGRHGDRVVVVLGALRVDGDDPLVAQVAPAAVAGDGRVVGLVGLPQRRAREGPRQALGGQQPRQRGPGRRRRSEDLGHPAGPAAHRHDHEVADLRVAAGALGERDPRPGLERRLRGRPAAGRHQLADQGRRRAAAAHPAAAASASPRCRASSRAGVAGSSTTRTSGGRPRLARSNPSGVR